MGSERRFEVESAGVHIRHPQPFGAAAVSSMIAFALAVTVMFFGSRSPSTGLALALLGTSLATAISSVAWLHRRFDPPMAAPRWRCRPGSIAVSAGAVTVSIGARLHRIERADLVAGWEERTTGRTSVLFITRTGHVISAEVSDDEEAQRVLERAGFSADRQVMRSRLAPAAHRNAGTRLVVNLVITALVILALLTGLILVNELQLVLAGLPVSTLSEIAAVFALVVLTLLGLVPSLSPPEILIGNDGVTIRSLFRRRFVPHADIAELRQKGNVIELALLGGEVVELRVSTRFVPKGGGVNPVQQAIHDRIWDALAVAEEQPIADSPAALDREGRPVAAWRAALAAIATGNTGYRRTALTPEAIAAVLDDVTAPRERRIGAALALAQAGDPALKLRIHAAAEAAADEDLARALETAAEEEASEEALERARRTIG